MPEVQREVLDQLDAMVERVPRVVKEIKETKGAKVNKEVKGQPEKLDPPEKLETLAPKEKTVKREPLDLKVSRFSRIQGQIYLGFFNQIYIIYYSYQGLFDIIKYVVYLPGYIPRS